MSLRKRLRPRLLAVYALGLAVLAFARPTPASLLAGGLLIVVGEGLRIWATGHLHKNDALTVSGPYAYLRHPLYLGTLLIALGIASAARAPVPLVAVAVFLVGYFGYFMPYKNRIEGARLEALYGDAFRRYAVAVPSLVPRIHGYVPLGDDGVATGGPGWRLDRFVDNNELGTAVAVAGACLVLVARWLLA